MAIPGTLPEWDATEVNAVEPDATHKAQGWLAPGGIPEKPPFQTFNYWMNSAYKWIAYFTNEARRLWQNQAVTHNITIDTDYALTADQNSYGRVIVTDTGVILTTGRNIIVDVSERSFLFQNDTAQALTVKTSTGTGIAVATGAKILLLCDGTNIIEAADSGSSTLNGLTDTNIATPLDTQVLTYDFASGKWINGTGGGASSLLAEHTVTGAAVTSVDFSGLDINTHKSYRLEIELYNPTGTSAYLYAFVNGDTVVSNYYVQSVQYDTTVATVSRHNGAEITTTVLGEQSKVDASISISNGISYIVSQSMGRAASLVRSFFYCQAKVATVTNITQLTFTSSVAGGIGIGSKFRIYKGD